MSWTPTQGMKRAEKLMLELKDTAEACGVQTSTALYPMYHARVFDLISKALDQALADGEQDAIDKVVGTNGSGHGPFPRQSYDGEVRGMSSYLATTKLKAEGTPLSDSVQRHMADSVIAAYEEGPGAPNPQSDYTHLDMAVANKTKVWGEGAFPPDTMGLPTESVEAPKKKRGRPKGSKAKKAKPAKAKAAKPAVVEDATGAADFVVAPAEAAQEPTVEATP